MHLVRSPWQEIWDLGTLYQDRERVGMSDWKPSSSSGFVPAHRHMHPRYWEGPVRLPAVFGHLSVHRTIHHDMSKSTG